jgi:hypothetical protein
VSVCLVKEEKKRKEKKRGKERWRVVVGSDDLGNRRDFIRIKK